MTTYKFTVIEGTQVFNGEIEAGSIEEAKQEVIDIYTYELGTDEESLKITIESSEVNKMTNYSKGMIIKMSGLSVKKENGVFEVENCWEKSCSVYKLKKDGTRIKSKYALDIFKYSKMDQFGEVITLEEVSAAISEINKQLKDRKENEVVISFESTTNNEYTNKSYIRVIQSIQTTSSIYAIPKNSVFQLSVNEKWNSVTWQRVGKRGELLSNYNGENMMTWGNKNMEKLFTEGYIEVVERVETVRKEIEQTEVNETPEQIEVIENVEVSPVVIEVKEETIVTENTTIENIEVVSAPIIEVTEEVETTIQNEITYQTGTGSKGNGIEITFTSKPSEEVRNMIKSNGYRWGGKQRSNVWWAILNDSTLVIAESLAGEQTTNETIDPAAVVYPEIDIDDNENYTIPQNIQDAEHDGHWLLRSEKPDHNKQLSEYFTQLTNEVKSIITTTENEYIIYKLKKTLQYYKKHYHQNYLARLTNKSNNPSWIVTGRAGRNSSRDAKYMNRYDKLMSEWIELDNDYKSRINTLKNKIRNEKKEALRNNIENTNVTIEFTTVTKEFTYMGYKEKKRVYAYGEYFICKLWNCFRLFHNEKEINIHLKTTDTLETAKKALSLYIQQQEQKAS